jgi:hypothetical protein
MVTERWGREDLLCSRLEALAPSVVAATPRKERGGAQSSGFVTCRPTNRTVVASYSRHLRICASIGEYRFQRWPSGDRQHQALRCNNCLPPSHPANPTPPDLIVARTVSGRAPACILERTDTENLRIVGQNVTSLRQERPNLSEDAYDALQWKPIF